MLLMNVCIVFFCMNSLNWTLVWLAPGGTQNSEFVFMSYNVITPDYWSNGHSWPDDPKINE